MSIDYPALAERYGTPLYVYDLDRVRSQARRLREAVSWNPCQLLYAIKSNPYPAIVRTLVSEDSASTPFPPRGSKSFGLRLPT